MQLLTTLMLLGGFASAVLMMSACKPPEGGTGGAKKAVVVMETSLGEITLELNAEKAPITVENFLRYVDDKHYDGTIFHRVISSFMIQGGGMEPGMREKPTRPPIQNESGNGLSNERGAIAMARTNDLNSATSQFFINVVDNKRLDAARYCVFGKVTDGMDVVDKIRRVETGSRMGHDDVPTQDILINSVRRVEKEEPKSESSE